MKTIARVPIREQVLVFSVFLTGSIQAEFYLPYALTPPAPGVYAQSGQYGDWTALLGNGTVNTANAPSQLLLAVPTGSIFANMLDFSTHAAADGWVTFDASAVSSGTGSILWRYTPVDGPGTVVLFPLDQLHDGQPQPFAFPVKAGDEFGFHLMSGSDAIPPGAPLMTTLTVENFSAPIPEPAAWALLAGGAVLMHAHRCRQHGLRR